MVITTRTKAGRRRRFRKALSATLAITLTAAIFVGCGSGADQPADSNSGSGNPAADQAVSYVNPGATGVALNNDRSGASDDATSLEAVQWSTEPVIRQGGLEAAGTLQKSVRLSEPMNNEPSAFSVYYGDNTEVLVELLPDLGPMHVWDTEATVAPSEFELEVDKFTIRAYSPLFMDVGPSDLLLRVWGYDESGQRVLLSALPVAVE